MLEQLKGLALTTAEIKHQLKIRHCIKAMMRAAGWRYQARAGCGPRWEHPDYVHVEPKVQGTFLTSQEVCEQMRWREVSKRKMKAQGWVFVRRNGVWGWLNLNNVS